MGFSVIVRRSHEPEDRGWSRALLASLPKRPLPVRLLLWITAATGGAFVGYVIQRLLG